MKLNMMIPSLLPIPAFSLSAVATAPTAPLALMASERRAPWAHQVEAELGNAVLVLDENKGTTGFKGNDSTSRKRYTDGGSGVPPRGRPV